MQEEMMNVKKGIWIGVVIVVLMVLGYLLTPYFYSQGEPKMEETRPVISYPELNVGSITAEHSYEDGRHSIVGGLSLPTPCHNLTTDSVVSEDKTEAIVNFNVTVDPNEICIQVITEKFFSILFSAPEDIVIKGFLNGQEVLLNLVKSGSVINKG